MVLIGLTSSLGACERLLSIYPSQQRFSNCGDSCQQGRGILQRDDSCGVMAFGDERKAQANEVARPARSIVVFSVLAWKLNV